MTVTMPVHLAASAGRWHNLPSNNALLFILCFTGSLRIAEPWEEARRALSLLWIVQVPEVLFRNGIAGQSFEKLFEALLFLVR